MHEKDIKTMRETMKQSVFRKILTNIVLIIGLSLVGVFLIPVGVLVVIIGVIWTLTDHIVRKLER